MKLFNFSASSSYFLCVSSLCVSVVTGYYIGYKRALSSDNTKSSPFLSSSFSLYPLWAKKKRKQSENDGKEQATGISSKTVKDGEKTDKDIGKNSKETNFVQR